MWQFTVIVLLVLCVVAGLASHAAVGYNSDLEQNVDNNISTATLWPEIIRPDSDGNSTQNIPSGEASNWQCVDDVNSDSDGTYIQGNATSYQTDTYAAQDHSAGSGTIDKVAVRINCRKVKSILDLNAYARTVIRTHDTDYEGNQILLTDSYTVYSTEYTTNPHTESAWTWSEIDALECGVDLKSAQDTVWDYARCTQVWVAVFYTP